MPMLSSNAGSTGTTRPVINSILILSAITSCLASISLFLYGLIVEGPAFYNGQECSMTYSQFQFLPLRVKTSGDKERYRLLKFTDARDPRHQHLYDVSGTLIENFDSQSKKRKATDPGRLLEYSDNWCLIPNNIADKKQWKAAPHPHRGHPVLYVPGHWGSFSQARSIGAHGTRLTGRSLNNKALYGIYETFQSGEGMHDGRDLNAPKSEDVFIDWYQSSYSLSHLNGFVMDVYSLDFNAEGAALHSSKLLRQAEFFARAIETMVEGCQLDDSGITIVAHSIGAWIVRIALKMHPHLTENGWVKNVITLASPLGGIPYAVDGGVHDIANHLNDENGLGNVTFISVSGGLRDEMIPPEACQIPSDKKTTSTNEAFLATTIMNKNAKDSKYQYGMDHRAVVWCYDLLKVVREVIFALVVTTDQEMAAYDRLNVARRIVLGKHNDEQYDFMTNAEQQRDTLLKDVGYNKDVAIQLATPYNLNLLLKLVITALLLDLHVLKDSDSLVLQTASRLIIIPLLVLAIFSIRKIIGCHGNECQLLLGTVFVLVQLATAIYSLICILVSPIIAAGIKRCFKTRGAASFSGNDTARMTFSTIFLQYFRRQFSHLLAVAPLVIGSVYALNHSVIDGSNDLAWNRTSIASYAVISLLTLQVLFIIKSLVVLSEPFLRSECKVALVFLLTTVKSTYGTVLYAYSLTSHWGQIDSDLYDEFLVASKSHTGSVFGHHRELLLCLLTRVAPSLFAINAVRAYADMRLQFNKTSNRASGDNKATNIENEAKQYQSYGYQSLDLAKAALTIWYTWKVFLSQSDDDRLIPAYAALTFITYYLKSMPISLAVLDIYSAIASNELSFCCSDVKDHNKKE